MGLGDVTLMAMAGAALGPTRTLLSVFVGAAIASVVFVAVVYPVVAMRRRAVATPVPAGETMAAAGTSSPEQSSVDVTGADTEEQDGLPLVPFGVFLAPATLVTLLWGDALVGWYQGLLR
jgi:leader peptidase (prepilin peptidase)/N-methyltransferase